MSFRNNLPVILKLLLLDIIVELVLRKNKLNPNLFFHISLLLNPENFWPFEIINLHLRCSHESIHQNLLNQFNKNQLN